MNAQRLDWDDLRIALAVCQTGSLSGAARQLGVNHSTVYRRISQIEDKVGVRLFERLPSGYVMTEAGEEVLAVSERINEEVNQLSRKLLGRDLHLSGMLRITAPDAFSLQVLMPHLRSFARRYPAIQLELILANSFFNLSRREADIAIRATNTPPEELIARRLGRLTSRVYAAASYLQHQAGVALGEYNWLMPDESLAPYPAAAWLRQHYPNARVILRSNSLLTLHAAASLGMGAAILPDFLVAASADLVPVQSPSEDLSSDLWLLTHPDLRRTARVRALIEHLLENIPQAVSAA